MLRVLQQLDAAPAAGEPRPRANAERDSRRRQRFQMTAAIPDDGSELGNSMEKSTKARENVHTDYERLSKGGFDKQGFVCIQVAVGLIDDLNEASVLDQIYSESLFAGPLAKADFIHASFSLVPMSRCSPEDFAKNLSCGSSSGQWLNLTIDFVDVESSKQCLMGFHVSEADYSGGENIDTYDGGTGESTEVARKYWAERIPQVLQLLSKEACDLCLFYLCSAGFLCLFCLLILVPLDAPAGAGKSRRAGRLRQVRPRAHAVCRRRVQKPPRPA